MEIKKIKLLKFLTALFFVFMFIFMFIRIWTNVPAYPKTEYILSDVQVALDQSHNIYAVFGWGNAFLYFTTLSNIIAIILLAVEWGSFGKIKVPKKIKIAGMLYMLVTGVVFWTSIAPFMPWGHDPFFDYECIHEHLIVMIAAIVFAVTDRQIVKAKIKDFIGMLVFPIAYLIMSIIIYFVTIENIAVYPFIDFYNWFSLGLPTWASILVTISFLVLLLAIFIAAYHFLIKLTNIRKVKIAK